MATIKKGLRKAQDGIDTKLKDVPGKVMAAGKRVVDKVKNATVRDAVDFIAPGINNIIDRVNPKEKKEGKPYKDNNRPFSVIRPVQGVNQFPPASSNRPSATRTALRPKVKSVVSKGLKSAGLKSDVKESANDDMRINIDRNGGKMKKKMKNGGSLSGLKASNKRVGPIDPKGAFTTVQKRTLAGAKGKAPLTENKKLGATKMTAKAGKKVSKKK